MKNKITLIAFFAISVIGKSQITTLSNGDVGVGNASPVVKLDVNGAIKTSRLGTYGTYSSSQVQGIWSINNSYKINEGSNNFGNQYGMGYSYNKIGGSPFASEHQIVFTNNGIVNAAIGLGGSGYFKGNVGIGTTSPTEKLEVAGNVKLSGNLNVLGISVFSGGINFSSVTDDYKMSVFGGFASIYGPVTLGGLKSNVYPHPAVGWTWGSLNKTPIAALNTEGHMQIAGNFKPMLGIHIPPNARLEFGSQDSTTGQLSIHNAKCCYNSYINYKGNLYISPDGNGQGVGFQNDGTMTVGVWEKYDNTITSTDGHKLMVNGGILCEKLKVIGDVPNSDYVFEKNYKLKTIKEVNDFITLNKHLPEVPSAKCFKEDGYNVGEMDDLLLRKVEELTLYIIQLNKEMEELKSAMAELR